MVDRRDGVKKKGKSEVEGPADGEGPGDVRVPAGPGSGEDLQRAAKSEELREEADYRRRFGGGIDRSERGRGLHDRERTIRMQEDEARQRELRDREKRVRQEQKGKEHTARGAASQV